MTGELSVLNTGYGDIRVTFNDQDDEETNKALQMLEDMQQRGYAIMVELPDGTYQRAERIDRQTKSYVLVPPKAARRGAKKRDVEVRQPIARTRAVGVARSAGG